MTKIILGLAGEIASGKGTVAKYLLEKHDGSTHRFSTMLRDVVKRMYLEENRENLQKLSTIFRQYFSGDILSKVIYHDVIDDNNKVIAIDGVRRYPDVEYLKTMLEFKLVYIETNMKNRYERIIKRGENTDDKNKTFEEFKKDQEREAEKDVKDLKRKADFIIDNNGTFENLYKQIDKIISES